MWWNEDLTEPLKSALQSVGVAPEDAVVHLSTDVDDDGCFSKHWLMITRTEVLVVTEAGRIVRRLPLAEIEDLEQCNYVGGGLLRATTAKSKVPLLRYSAARGVPLGIIARGFKQFKEKGEIDPGPFQGQKKCPECGRPLDRDESFCPRCVSKKRILKRLWQYARPFKFQLAVIAIIITATAAGGIGTNLLTKFFIDNVFNTSPPNAGLLLPLVLAYAGVMVFNTLLGAWREYQSVFVGMNLVYNLRGELFRRVMGMGLPFFDKFKAGELMSRVDNDSSQLQSLLINIEDFLFGNLVMVVVVLGVLLWLNWQLALLVLIPVPLVLGSGYAIYRWVVPAWHALRQRQADMSSALNSALTGVRLVKAFRRERHEIERFTERSGDYRDTGVQLGRAFALVFPAIGFTMQIGMLLVWYIGGQQVLSGLPGHMTLGDLMAFVGLLGMFYGPFFGVVQASRWATMGLASAQRIFDILDTEPDRADQEAQVAMPAMQGRIRFDRVTFGYEPLKPVLKGVDLEISPGEMIGLVGQSGVGKTTTTNLILRFYTVNEGTLSIDGVDIRAISADDLRRQMASVPQEPHLFSGSVVENLMYGRAEATPEEVIAAAFAANAHDFIMRTSDGYDSGVGEQGSRLSVGEKQRVTIARAILRNPRVLILDEATSSVDTDTEKQIQEALDRLVKERTTIAIAHRLSTLKNADRLVVLKDGKVEEVGTHDELIQKGGEYKRLVEMQSQMSSIRAVDG